MEDAEKAIVMTVHALMFVLALTIAIVLYYKINGHIKDVIADTDNSNRGDAIYAASGTDAKRKIKRSEVIIAVLNMGDGGIQEVDINGATFSLLSDGRIKHGLKKFDITNPSDYDDLRKELFDLTDASDVYVLNSFSKSRLSYSK